MRIKDFFNAAQGIINKIKNNDKGAKKKSPNTEKPRVVEQRRPWHWFFKTSLGTVWMQHDGSEYIDDSFPWKLHIFASSVDDYLLIVKQLSEEMHRMDLTFKTIDCVYGHPFSDPDYNMGAILDPMFQGQPNSQYGKAFTVYFNRAEDMYRVAKYLDTYIQTYIPSKPNSKILNFDKHNLGAEKQYGSSGRIFYRAERDANGEYIEADYARKINPKQPHNPFNMPDPIQQGIENDNKDYAFIVSHMSIMDFEKGKYAIKHGYEEEVIAILKRHLPMLWLDKTDDGCIEFQSGLNGMYTTVFLNGLKNYVKQTNLVKSVAGKGRV